MTGKPSDNERLKNQSDYLHGTISHDLTDGITGSFKGDNFQLIRFHGMYEQDDRDIRNERGAQKLEPLKSMMLRCRLPGGIIQPKQWLGIDQFASEHTLYGSIRLTNRQTFQYHGVLKPDVKPMHQWLHRLGLDSIATASDVNRNVLCTTNPVESSLHKEAYEWAKKISMQLLPRTSAYAAIWLDGEKVFSSEPPKPLNKEIADDVEPILGKTYLPRKFKTAVVIPPDNEVDIHSNDLGFVAIEEDGHLVGFNVLVGGGLSSEHGNTTTFPNKSYEFGYVPLSHTLHCAEAVVTTQRDWGHPPLQIHHPGRPHRLGQRRRRQLAPDLIHRKRPHNRPAGRQTTQNRPAQNRGNPQRRLPPDRQPEPHRRRRAAAR